ncbi:hypothetical protein Tco_1001871 [Tanacetum coccineum]
MVTKNIDEEKSGKRYTSSKEVKDNCFKSVHVIEVAVEYGGKKLPQTDNTLKDLDTEDIGTCIRVLELTNSQDNRNPTWAGDQTRIREKDVPSYRPRKKNMGGQIFCAQLELTVGFDLRAFEGLNCDIGGEKKE